MNFKWIIIVWLLCIVSSSFNLQNVYPAHERLSKEKAEKMFKDVLIKLYDIKGEMQFIEKCLDNNGLFYFVTTLSKGKYLTNKGDSVYDKLSFYKFFSYRTSLNKSFEYNDEELPKFITGVEKIELNIDQFEFVDTNNDSLLEIITVHNVVSETGNKSSKIKLLIFNNDTLSMILIGKINNSKTVQISPNFYTLPIKTQNYIINKIYLMNVSNVLPKNWKKGIKRKKTLIK